MALIDQAFVLRSRPYRETSAIVQYFTAHHGRVDAVARGVYRKNRQGQQMRSTLQTGNRVELQWAGNGSLKTALQCELVQQAGCASARHLVCLSYINELLLQFLPAEQPAGRLFDAYSYLVQAMAIDSSPERILRLYEFELFEEMGCAIDFLWDCENSQPVEEGFHYTVEPGSGVIVNHDMRKPLLGATELYKLAQRQLDSRQMLQLAKQVNRLLIDFYLAGKPLKARELYRQL